MNFVLKDIRVPARLRFTKPMNDVGLLHFSAANDHLRLEREANGEILIMQLADAKTGSVEIEIGAQLFLWARTDGGGRAFGPSLGIRLQDTSVRTAAATWFSPDSFLVLQRQRKLFASVCPEFIVEVRSCNDNKPRLEDRMAMWIANGVEVAWLLDQDQESVTIYRTNESTELLHKPTSVQGTGPIAGFELKTKSIWAV